MAKTKTPLEKYRLSEGLSYRDLAEHLTKSKETVRRWCLGICEPRRQDRIRIQKKTANRVVFGTMAEGAIPLAPVAEKNSA